MRYAGLLGKASAIASAVYRSLPEEKKVHNYYRKLTGQAMRLLKENKTAEEVMKLLQPGKIKKIVVATVFKNTVEQISFADEILMQVFAETMNVKEESFCCGDEAPP